jgi:hypothetical protein
MHRLAALTVAAAAVAAHDVSPLASLSVADVQALLQDRELLPFFGAEFEKFRVDGEALALMEPGDIDPADFPAARKFHWRKLWAFVDDQKKKAIKDTSSDAQRPEADGDGGVDDATASSSSTSSSSNGGSNSNNQDEDHGRSRRRLASAKSAGAGLQIKQDDAFITMGTGGDVALYRSGVGELTLTGRMLVDASDGSGAIDVAAALGSLLQCNCTKTDQKLDLLLEMVAANTELIHNVSAHCEAAAANTRLLYYDCQDTYDLGLPSGLYPLEDGSFVSCNNDLSVGGWTLVSASWSSVVFHSLESGDAILMALWCWGKK